MGRDTTGHGIDYSSLEVGHLGHIYEALLSLRLSVADQRCATIREKIATYPTKFSQRLPSSHRTDANGDQSRVSAGSLLWLTNEGGRKAGGVYYTPASLVEHLVRHHGEARVLKPP